MGRRLLFLPCLVPLALAAVGHSSVGLLQASAAAVIVVALLFFRASTAGRWLVVDGLAPLSLGVVVLFYTCQGAPVPFRLSLVLAPLLVVSTALGAWAVEAEGAERSPPHRTRAAANALAFLVVTFAAILFLTAVAFRPAVVGYAWLVGSVTALGLVPLALFCLPRGRLGAIGVTLALVGLEIALVWFAASIEVAMEQGRALQWDELRVRLGEPGGWRVALEGITSLKFALLTGGIFAGQALLARVFGRLKPVTCLLAAIRLVASVAAFGGLLLGQPALADPALAQGYLEACAAPWLRVRERAAQARPLDMPAAARARARLEPPFWEAGPAEPLAGLAGRYPRRSLVVVLMESQAARLLPGLGEGAYAFSPAQPELARLAREGLLFTNYFAPGLPTHSALWTLLTGLPVPRGALPAVQRAPQAVRLGRMPDLAALGYRSDWLCPASPRFDNWDRLMNEAGVRWWIDNREVHDLDRRYWTAWGMPDEQLYRVALARYLAQPDRGRGYFVGLLTVSNHSPFLFPPAADGRARTADHEGGTGYADQAVGQFVDALRALPPAEQPIIFLTADTAQIEGLREHPPLGIYSPEAARIPGLLLLPDGAGAGQRFDGVFCHEDLLDLLYLLVSPPAPGGPRKFVDRQRGVAVGFGGLLVASPGALCAGAPLQCFRVEDRWRLVPAQRTAVPQLVAALAQFEEGDAALWGAPAPPAP